MANILVDSRPRVAEFTPDGKHVWVSAEIGGTVAVIDCADYKVAKKFGFEIPGIKPELIQPMGIDFPRTASWPSSPSAAPIVSPSSTPRPTR